jgi:hypothetical protein
MTRRPFFLSTRGSQTNTVSAIIGRRRDGRSRASALLPENSHRALVGGCSASPKSTTCQPQRASTNKPRPRSTGSRRQPFPPASFVKVREPILEYNVLPVRVFVLGLGRPSDAGVAPNPPSMVSMGPCLGAEPGLRYKGPANSSIL